MPVEEGAGGGGGERVVNAGIVEEDMGDGLQCSNHPYRNNPGGICAFCLQEKLGKLVSGSFPRSSSCSSSPSFRSDVCVSNGGGNGGIGGGNGGGVGVVSSASLSLSLAARHKSTESGNDCGFHEYNKRRARIPFLLNKKKKKIMAASSSSSDRAAESVFRRSKSTTTPRRGSFANGDDGKDYSLRKRGGFWSFLFLSSMAVNTQKIEKCSSSKKGNMVVDDESPNSEAIGSVSSSERKVSRSRSVGCGSRSFSGDFFERISTGFGDCTLRRVESQREGKSKAGSSAMHGDRRYMKERVKCGGLFSGFIMTSSSSSSSSSSYWVSDINGKSTAPAPAPMSVTANGNLVHGRHRSWGWAFASPMRAFGKTSSKDGKINITGYGSKTTTTAAAAAAGGTTNLSAIPPLLAVG